MHKNSAASYTIGILSGVYHYDGHEKHKGRK